MNVPAEAVQAYATLQPYLAQVEKRVVDALLAYSKKSLNPFVHRLKSLESIVEKIETGRFKAFSALDDLFAATIIVPGLANEADAVSFCERTFEVKLVKARGAARKSPDQFRFDGTRVYASLRKPDGLDAGLSPNIYDVVFEVQVRTAFEHAWTVATHDLTYKSQDVDWRKIRLAAQIKANVEQLDLLVSQFDSLIPAVKPSIWEATDEQAKFCELVLKLAEEGIIPSEARPHDLSRFAENFSALVKSSGKSLKPSEAMKTVESALRKLAADQKFPMSASLLQICIGILSGAGMLVAPFNGRYVGHITPELANVFPAVQGLKPTFKYD